MNVNIASGKSNVATRRVGRAALDPPQAVSTRRARGGSRCARPTLRVATLLLPEAGQSLRATQIQGPKAGQSRRATQFLSTSLRNSVRFAYIPRQNKVHIVADFQHSMQIAPSSPILFPKRCNSR